MASDPSVPLERAGVAGDRDGLTRGFGQGSRRHVINFIVCANFSLALFKLSPARGGELHGDGIEILSVRAGATGMKATVTQERP